MSRKKPPKSWTSAPLAKTPHGLWQLWQAPMFLVGVLALAGVCLSRPFLHPDDRWLQDRNLETARRLLFQPDCTPEQMRELVARSLSTERVTPQRGGEAHLLLGSSYLNQVNLDCPSLDQSPRLNSEAITAVKHARKHLEKAETLGVPNADRAKLRYRLGKVWYLTGEAPDKVIEALAGSVEEGAADNFSEGYALLTQAYLRLPQPNLKAALEINKKQMNLPVVQDEMLAPARLLRGELLLRLDDPVGARDVLKFVKPPAPPAMIAQARFLQARTFQEEHEWAKAGKLWKEALDHRKPGSPEAGQILYHLGVCLRKLDDSEEAGKAWEKALLVAPSDEAVAAALGLAELRLLESKPENALEAFRRAVRDTATANEWKNPYWTLNATSELFERGCLILHATGRYELAIQLAEAYEKVAPSGATTNLIAQAAEAAGKAKLEQAKQAKTREAGLPLEAKARDLFRLAAQKHEKAAESLPSVEQPERHWQAAECLFNGQDYTNAVRLLDRLAKQGPPADRAAQVWFLLGEAQRALHQKDAAVVAYTESASHRGPYAFRARHQLAVVEMARDQVDTAAEQLERILGDLSTDPDPEAHQKTLFALGGLLFRKKNGHEHASRRLEEALRHYPAAPESTLARYQLGECYRALAQKEIVSLKKTGEKVTPDMEALHLRLHRERLNQSAATHEELIRVLNSKLAAGGTLSEEESGLFWRATLAAAECRTDLGDYRGPITTYEDLANRFKGRVEALYALAGIARCLFHQVQPDRAREVLERMRKIVEAMDDAAFPITEGMMPKAEWQQWISLQLLR